MGKVIVNLVQKYFRMIAVLIVFLAVNKKRNLMKKYQNETATRQRRYSVTVRDTIERRIYTQKNKTGTGHQQDRDERETTVTTACKTGTRH